MTASPPGRRARSIRWLGGLISLVSLGAVVWWASRQEAPELPTSAADLAALGTAIGLYAANTLLRGERWLALLARSGAGASRADAYGLTAVGYMGNNVLPARAGDVLRVVLMAPRAATRKTTVVGTLIVERLLDVVVLAVLFGALAGTVAGGAGLPSGDALALLAAAAGAGLLAAAVVAVVLARRGVLRRALDAARPIVAPLLALGGRHGAAMLALTVVVWALEAAVWWSVGAAAGLDFSALEALYLVALASMFSLIPSGPGYAGTQDAAAVLGVKALGGSSAAAVSYLVLVRFVLLVPITIVGLAVLVARYGGLGRLRAARAEATTA